MRRSTFSSQRGAVLIHVAIALLGLIAFSTFVTDYGVMWVSRAGTDGGRCGCTLGSALAGLRQFDRFRGSKGEGAGGRDRQPRVRRLTGRATG
jgi:hypothetical protein